MSKIENILIAVIVAVMLVLIAMGGVQAETFRAVITRGVPTVSGIGPGASSQGYRSEAPAVRMAPRARVFELGQPAPAGRCGSLFEVVSGPLAQRGCYGQN